MAELQQIGTLTNGYARVVQPIAATAIATDTAGLVAGEVRVPTADGAIPAYRAMPETGGPFPVILVIQEIFGVHTYIQDVCRRLAKEGFCAVAPELFVRQGDPAAEEEMQGLFTNVVMQVPDAQVLADLDACVAWADGDSAADTARLSITGFCWGGRIVWLYAAHQARLNAGVAWYGRLVGGTSDQWPAHPVEVAGALHAPVLGLYGEEDQGIPVKTVEQMRAALQTAGDPSEFVLYPGAPHGFHSDYRDSYHAEAATDGWRRLHDWLTTHGAV